MFFTANDVIPVESPRQSAGNTIAYVARESLVSDFEGVLYTVRSCVATVNKVNSDDNSKSAATGERSAQNYNFLIVYRALEKLSF